MPKITPQAKAVLSGRNVRGLSRHATRHSAMTPADARPSGSRMDGPTLTGGDCRPGDRQEQDQAAGAAQDPGGGDPVGPAAGHDVGDHDGEQQVQDQDRLDQGQRPEVQGERLHHRAGDVDGDPDHPEPVGRQFGEELEVERRPLCHLVGGALLDDVGCAERDSTRDRRSPRRAPHSQRTRCLRVGAGLCTGAYPVDAASIHRGAAGREVIVCRTGVDNRGKS